MGRQSGAPALGCTDQSLKTPGFGDQRGGQILALNVLPNGRAVCSQSGQLPWHGMWPFGSGDFGAELEASHLPENAARRSREMVLVATTLPQKLFPKSSLFLMFTVPVSSSEQSQALTRPEGDRGTTH